LIESTIQKNKRGASERWPDYNCPFKKLIDDKEGLCLKDTPTRKYSITPADCWACLKRRKLIREEYGHTANGKRVPYWDTPEFQARNPYSRTKPADESWRNP